jgi:hypothetical protein
VFRERPLGLVPYSLVRAEFNSPAAVGKHGTLQIR